jgi:hypothetical protein
MRARRPRVRPSRSLLSKVQASRRRRPPAKRSAVGPPSLEGAKERQVTTRPTSTRFRCCVQQHIAFKGLISSSSSTRSSNPPHLTVEGIQGRSCRQEYTIWQARRSVYRASTGERLSPLGMCPHTSATLLKRSVPPSSSHRGLLTCWPCCVPHGKQMML